MSWIQTRNSGLLSYQKSWKYTALMEAHDKLGHQGATHTYCLIKHQYYWKGMNKDIIDESGTAENKEELLFSHDKLSLASILRPLHQVTKEMLV